MPSPLGPEEEGGGVEAGRRSSARRCPLLQVGRPPPTYRRRSRSIPRSAALPARPAPAPPWKATAPPPPRPDEPTPPDPLFDLRLSHRSAQVPVTCLRPALRWGKEELGEREGKVKETGS
ncbi:hypothetical protein [Oryza sativa Japonica Group]|uniref:Uncharacterized protein n=1 Tax=Oryza sativa subsp. japonica TaxID=39947 RepID=Q5N840_ORYSJ|nr:hypothetical protein [Oryza sativa Japonica Group]